VIGNVVFYMSCTIINEEEFQIQIRIGTLHVQRKIGHYQNTILYLNRNFKMKYAEKGNVNCPCCKLRQTFWYKGNHFPN
jgi:hypothetical protein